ncbi:MAG: NTP transferase domain-containing protein [Bacteroidales bacterium]|nr:NTP transferase domain-containing protein [Bacteroidales bacterium]
MKAFIFAAGLGTRLKPLTDRMPKALVPVGGRPLIWHVIRKLQKAGVDEFIINVHHYAEMISDYLELEDFFGARIELSVEEEMPLETGGGLRKAAELLQGSGSFFAHNVDIISNADLAAMAASERPDALATLLVSQRNTQRYLLFNQEMRLVGWTNVATGEVRSPFKDLRMEDCSKYAFAGIHYISEKILPLLQEMPERFSIMDFYLKMAAELPIYGFAPEELEIVDAGKPETLERASQMIEKG